MLSKFEFYYARACGHWWDLDKLTTGSLPEGFLMHKLKREMKLVEMKTEILLTTKINL